MTDKVLWGTALKRDLIRRVEEVEYHVLSFGALLRCEQYGPIEGLAYPWMVFGCVGGAFLLYVQLDQIKSCYAFGICRLLQNMAVDPVLSLVAIARVTKVDLKALEGPGMVLI